MELFNIYHWLNNYPWKLAWANLKAAWRYDFSIKRVINHQQQIYYNYKSQLELQKDLTQMPVIQFSQSDLLRGRLLDPGWYTVKIETIGEKPSKDGGSQNYPVHATVIRNADDGKTEGIEKTPLDWNFNNKALGFAVGFIAAVTGVDPEKLPTDKRIELSDAAGKVIDVFVERGEYNGNPKNNVVHKYRPTKERS